MIRLLNLIGGMHTLNRLPPRWAAMIAYRAAWIDVRVGELIEGLR